MISSTPLRATRYNLGIQMECDFVSQNAETLAAVQQLPTAGGPLVEEVPDIPDGEPFAQEWQAFKRELHRLVDEGNQGRFALIKGNQVASIWDTLRDAQQAGLFQFGTGPFLIQEVQLFLKPMRWGYYHPWRE